ncbi:MAG: hypothetical protein V1645_02985 [archaeon]
MRIAFVLALVVLSFFVFADCTMPYSFLPPEVSSGSTVTMDGYEWTISERTRGSNMVYRVIARANFEHIDRVAYITNEQAETIARNFFERNSHILGTPSSIIVTVAGNKLPAIVKFVGTERQLCDGIPVIGTVSGLLYIGEGDEIQVSSLEIEWYISANTNLVPTVPMSEILEQFPNSDPQLALLPKNDDEMTLVWELNDSKNTLIDAQSGKEVVPPSPYDKYYKILLFLIPAAIVVAVGYVFLRKTGKPKIKKINKGITH